MEHLCHNGPKSQKITFLDEFNVVSAGYNKNFYREMALWDIRKPEKRVQNTQLDNATGSLFPQYDADLKVLYLWGVGNGNIRFYEYEGGKLHYLSHYQSKVNQRSLGFYPKHKLDTTKCEVMKAIKLTDKTAEYLSFIQPKRSELFCEDLYPDCVSNKPALTAEEWFNGKNAEALRMSLRPGDQNNQQ